jgi:uncharacterized protein (TIGR02246 family)
MRNFLILIGLIAGMVIVISPAVQSQSESKKRAAAEHGDRQEKSGQPAPERSADEKAIRETAEVFEKAYNAKDAKAIAALFVHDGQIEDKDGDVSVGRDAIEKVFADIFKEAPKKTIDVTVESIRFIGPDLAVEEGSTKEVFEPGEPPEYDRYTVVHVKRDGKWMMAMAKDEEGPPPSGHEQLRPLAWLVGDWVDDGGSTVVVSSCRWSDDKNFLLQEFKLRQNGRDAMNVSQRIGWDPVTKAVHSWVFDSEGGYGESVWTRDGDSWIIKATGVRPDGTTASATNSLTPAGKDGYIWRSTDRIQGDEVQAPTEVKVVRKPPEPKK